MEIKNIKDPSFLKKMNPRELNGLCEDIRNFIVESVSKTGGHLSSNLGIVELTVALHRVFDTTEDKLIFDVGHQCYTHKILTGRADMFSTLRCTDGLSGFQSRSESIHDCYEGGHAGTSLSAALGFAKARDAAGGTESVIAVIGDGCMGNGISYEALNQIGDYNRPLIIILNDNSMSISPNVGALHNSLERIRAHSGYLNAKTKTKSFLNHLPHGEKMIDRIGRTKENLKKLYIQQDGALFEELGITYYGPINGHNIEELESILRSAKLVDHPILLHVITQKGHGCSFCEEDTDGIWHGVGSFDSKSGEIRKGSGTTPGAAVSEALTVMAEKNKKIFAITPAMENGAHLAKFHRRFPDRFIDAGIAEEHALIMANALALAGNRPFATIYSSFLQRGYDQIIHDIARMNSPVVVGVDRSGIIGEDGISHQGIYDVSFLLPIPGIIIAQGKDACESTRLLATAFSQDKPFLLRYSKNPVPKQKLSLEPVKTGSWECISKGTDINIITYGDIVSEAEKAARLLEEEGIDAGVINARFLKPVDESMFDELLLSGVPIIVYEEVPEIGGLGSYLRHKAAQKNNHLPIYSAGIPDSWVLHGKRTDILKRLGLDCEGLLLRIKGILSHK